MNNATTKSRVEALEELVKKQGEIIDSLNRKVESFSNPVVLGKPDGEIAKVNPFDEMTPDQFFGKATEPSFTYGEIPVDGRGRIADPSWKYNQELDVFEKIKHGVVVKTVKKTGKNSELVI